MGRLFCFLLALLLQGGGVTWAAELPVLRVLAWPGYADADLVRVFEQRHKVRVEVTLVSTDEALREKLARRNGGDYDVVAANTAEISRFVDLGLLQALDLAGIPRTRAQARAFRDLTAIPGLTRGGRVYAVPYTYAEMGLIYDRTRVREPPGSTADLWDPAFQGRVVLYDGSGHNFTLAAIRLGLPDPFHLSDADFLRATQALVDLRRNALGFYSLPEEATELFRRDGGVLLFANYGAQQVKLLRAAGADIGYVLPREGALAWLDCWAVTRGARDKALAQAWIDYMLEAPVSAALTERQGLANTLDAPQGGEGQKRLWLEPVEDPERRAALWRRIVSGDTPEKLRKKP
ncbi:MAG: extracellular solute-binding protein [Pseudomonadota bacterium]